MATEEQMKKFICRFHEMHPANRGEYLDKTRDGMGAVMKFLGDKGEPMRAGDIASELHISTARVAAILKNMEAKDLVVRTKDPADQRVTFVTLTDKALIIHEEHELRMKQFMEKIIDEIGEERLDDFFQTAKDIQEILMKGKGIC